MSSITRMFCEAHTHGPPECVDSSSPEHTLYSYMISQCLDDRDEIFGMLRTCTTSSLRIRSRPQKWPPSPNDQMSFINCRGSHATCVHVPTLRLKANGSEIGRRTALKRCLDRNFATFATVCLSAYFPVSCQMHKMVCISLHSWIYPWVPE